MLLLISSSLLLMLLVTIIALIYLVQVGWLPLWRWETFPRFLGRIDCKGHVQLSPIEDPLIELVDCPLRSLGSRESHNQDAKIRSV